MMRRVTAILATAALTLGTLAMPQTALAAEELTIRLETEDPQSNDDLFEKYMDSYLEGSQSLTGQGSDLIYTGQRASSRGETLSGTGKTLYDTLSSRIRKIAAGEETKTVIEISGIYSDALNRKVLGMLQADLPLELYWLDKTRSVSVTTGIGVDRNTTTWSFPVAKDYSATGAASTYEIKSDMATVLSTVKTNVDTLLGQNKEATDIEKVKNYAKNIMELVEYNTEPGNSYGGPWQLLYVFDGDMTTNVVCEGYAKAFKYMCDRGGIDCDIVCGVTTSGRGKGDHMWNLVTIDGKRYMVDVTNCDDGAIGEPDHLLLKKPTSQDAGISYTYVIDEYNKITYYYDEETRGMYTVAELTVTGGDMAGDPDVIIVRFDLQGGKGKADDITVTYEGKYGTLPSDITKDGYTFTGWFTEASGGTQVKADTVVNDKTTPQTLYAQYIAKDSIKVTLDPRGGTVNKDYIEVTKGSKYSGLPTEATRAGYMFEGWYTEITDGKKIVDGDDLVSAENHTLYARWKLLNECVVTYRVNGGTPDPGSVTYKPGQKLGKLPTPTRKGYTFLGWYYETGVKASMEDFVQKDVTLYAQWLKITDNGNNSGNNSGDNGNTGTKTEKTENAYGGITTITTHTAEDGTITRSSRVTDSTGALVNSSTETIKKLADGSTVTNITLEDGTTSAKEITETTVTADGSSMSTVVKISANETLSRLIVKKIPAKGARTQMEFISGGGTTLELVDVPSSGTELVIPSTIKAGNGRTYTVDSIGKGALKGNDSITRLVIPRTVTDIGKAALRNARKLNIIDIDVGDAEDLTIGKNAFKGVVARVNVSATNRKTYKKAVNKITKSGGKKLSFVKSD